MFKAAGGRCQAWNRRDLICPVVERWTRGPGNASAKSMQDLGSPTNDDSGVTCVKCCTTQQNPGAIGHSCWVDRCYKVR